MAKSKQMMEIDHSTGINGAESNEYQRKWTKEQWEERVKKGESNYDMTRIHLNFEITKGGKIQAIDKSKTVEQKLEESLAARGIKNPNKRDNVKREQNIFAKIVLGGSTEQMRRLAFGNQDVDFFKQRDNSHIVRCKEIEDWAVDSYNFIARHFGEDNIISFIVHLDETNPHIHCSLVPVDENTNRISWKNVFGKNPRESSNIFNSLHDAYAEEVNAKYGLERGDSVKLTGAKHISNEQHKIELTKQIISLEEKKLSLQEEIDELRKDLKQVRTAIKGLNTMLTKLNVKRDDVQEKIETITAQHEDGSLSDEEFNILLHELHLRLDKLEEDIEDKTNKLAEKEKELLKKQQDLEIIKKQLYKGSSDYLKFRGARTEEDKKFQPKYESLLKACAYEDYQKEFSNVIAPSLMDYQMDKVEQQAPVTSELLDNADEVMQCALLFMQGYVEAATSVFPGGGGGASSDLPWRDKDDDDNLWARKCFNAAVNLSRNSSSGQSQKQSRGRKR